MQIGERMFVWCDGGPAIGRTVTCPPSPELAAEHGLYVLIDEGVPSEWRYEFVADTMLG